MHPLFYFLLAKIIKCGIKDNIGPVRRKLVTTGALSQGY
jgi:hypothetical protein